MPVGNNKSRFNSYAYNRSNSYNRQSKLTPINFMGARNNYYDSQYVSPYVLSGGNSSGAVWTNPNVYNVAYEDLGISWVL
jgi:hypothetical protein